MPNLLITVVLVVCLLLAFRLFDKYGVNTFNGIVFNYATCLAIGLLVDFSPSNFYTENLSWFFYAAMVGCCFIGAFYLVGRSVTANGLGLTSVANKMSMAVPVIFNILVGNMLLSETSLANISGLILAIISVALCSWPQSKVNASQLKPVFWLLPVVFITSGLTDTAINWVQNSFADNTAVIASVPMVTFGAAATIGLFMLGFQALTGKAKVQTKDVVGGVFLGIPNYFSVVFLLKALKDYGGNGAFVFPVLNLLVIITSVLISVFIFKERFSRLNQVGLLLAIVSLYLFMN